MDPLHELRAELVKPGRTLVFIDDSGTPGNKLGEHLVRDYKLQLAAVTTSENYAAFLTAHETWKSLYPWADEFHAHRVCRGKKDGWEMQTVEVRQRAFNTFAGFVGRWTDRLYFVGVGSDQYKRLTMAANANAKPYPYNMRWDLHGEGARVVLIKSLIGRLHPTHSARPIVIVEDSDGGAHDCQEEMFSPGTTVFRSSVFRVDSKAVPGIQLADLAAYSLNRLHHIRAKLKTDEPTHELDAPIMRFLQSQRGKLLDVLSASPSRYEIQRERNRDKRKRRKRQ